MLICGLVTKPNSVTVGREMLVTFQQDLLFQGVLERISATPTTFSALLRPDKPMSQVDDVTVFGRMLELKERFSKILYISDKD